MIRTMPLNKLLPSPHNVRRASDEQADLQLKADIEARGLLQNLVVAPSKKPKGRFTVEAGGRRLRALKTLAHEGKLAVTHDVCCLVLDGGPAGRDFTRVGSSLVAMPPANPVIGFKTPGAAATIARSQAEGGARPELDGGGDAGATLRPFPGLAGSVARGVARPCRRPDPGGEPQP